MTSETIPVGEFYLLEPKHRELLRMQQYYCLLIRGRSTCTDSTAYNITEQQWLKNLRSRHSPTPQYHQHKTRIPFSLYSTVYTVRDTGTKPRALIDMPYSQRSIQERTTATAKTSIASLASTPYATIKSDLLTHNTRRKLLEH